VCTRSVCECRVATSWPRVSHMCIARPGLHVASHTPIWAAAHMGGRAVGQNGDATYAIPPYATPLRVGDPRVRPPVACGGVRCREPERGCEKRRSDTQRKLKIKLQLRTTPLARSRGTCRRSWAAWELARPISAAASTSTRSSSGAPSWARADQEPPPARAWSPPTPTTAPSEAPSPGETPRDPKQPWDPKTAMKVGARSARDRHRRARGRSRGARGRFGAQLTWEAEVEEVGLYPELGS